MATTTRIPGLVLIDHEIEVPLDHANPGGPTITVFAREVRRPGDGDDRDPLLFLQGGPGGESPRPTGIPEPSAWLNRALQDYRVFLLDQRGTGRSTPITALADKTPQEQADYLALFRADAIVEDCEVLREQLHLDRWSLLGQSFGGFCTLRYLSAHPDSVKEAMFTGGVPPIGVPVDEIYAATYERVMALTARHYRAFPGDRDRMRALAERAAAGRLRLPNGTQVSADHLRGIGAPLGMTGGSEQLHYLLERDPDGLGFGYDLAELLSFNGHSALYVLVHEACYADGGVTDWSSARVRPDAYLDDPSLLTGEHVFPFHVSADPLLAPFQAAADLLARRDWPQLYDRSVLAGVEVPAAAAIYYDDPYVLREYSLRTVEEVPAIRPFITNTVLHNGLRLMPEEILGRLIQLVRGQA